ncbi:Heme chaperone HemW [Buchnera aphidicola (Pterocallis alni)]
MLIPQLGLYIHIPWCLKKCLYCDFNTYQIKKNTKITIHYIKHMIHDLINDTYLIKNRIIKTIFIGGGTPSLLNYKLLKILMNNIKNIINIDNNIEFTIEINPEFITIDTVIKYTKIGINRISIGVQSFNNKILKSLGRTHSSITAIKIIKQIKKNTKLNINIDLMYGLPNQTISQCIIDLKQAISLKPNHISWYQLNIEKNTIFYYQKPSIPQEEKIWKMYTKGNKLLHKNNYKKYEISSYTKNNSPCYHNLNYWKFGDYIGIGCGSYGKFTQITGKIIRTIKQKRIYDYINNKKQYLYKIYNISNQDRPFEYFINTFRLLKPINKKHFYQSTKIKPKNIQHIIKKSILKKYLIETENYWSILPYGRIFLNNLLSYFIHI